MPSASEMDSSTPVRRSGRKRQRKKYSVDAFEGLEVLSDATDIDRQEAREADDSISSEDEEFTLDDATKADEMSLDNEVEVISEGSSVAGSVREEELENPTPARREQKPASTTRKEPESATAPSSIGVSTNYDRFHSLGKRERYNAVFGSETRDMVAAIKCRDKWYNDLILPKREADSKGRGGFSDSFFRTEDAREAEATKDWEWYFEGGGKETLEGIQQGTPLETDDGEQYLPQVSGESLRLLMGPWQRQKMVSLGARELVNVAEVWRQAEEEHLLPSQKQRHRQGRREAWILNLGDVAQHMTWVPVSHGRFQYLALATASSQAAQGGCRSQANTQSAEQQPPKAPAFAASPPLPACIQFWAIPSSAEPGKQGEIDFSLTPTLSLVLCTNWGPVKQMKWCLAPRAERPTTDGSMETALLASVWGDGKVRVLKVRFKHAWEAPTQYLRIDKAAFESCPPGTICTSVDWLSSSHIAAGCANGFVAIWDLAEHLSNERFTPPSPNPRPFFYHPLHQTYILSIASCYPSFPELIVTSSMDGYVRLTNIHTPTSDYALAQRSRIGTSIAEWCDALQCVLTSEENNTLHYIALRRFYGSTILGRLSGNVTAVAPGAMHTSVLAGGADGSVIALNAMRKFISNKAAASQLTWFQHNWSRKDGGFSRIVEGFKVDRPTLVGTLAEGKRFPDGTLWATIFEERSAITHVAWNPNMACGGWAAAAMGDGLVRIEDLAI